MLFQQVDSKSTVYTLSKWSFFGLKRYCLQMVYFLLDFSQNSTMHNFGRKKCLILCYFNKSVQTVQCIHCLNDPFSAKFFFFLQMLNFLVDFNQNPIVHNLGRERFLILWYFNKSAQKVHSLYTVQMIIFWPEKIFLANVIFFVRF